MALVQVDDRVKAIILSVVEIVAMVILFVAPQLGWDMSVVSQGLAAAASILAFVFGIIWIHPGK